MMNFNPCSCKMNERTLETNTPFRTRGPTPETANNRFTSQITAFSFASTVDRQDDQASSDGFVAVSRFGYCPLANLMGRCPAGAVPPAPAGSLRRFAGATGTTTPWHDLRHHDGPAEAGVARHAASNAITRERPGLTRRLDLLGRSKPEPTDDASLAVAMRCSADTPERGP